MKELGTSRTYAIATLVFGLPLAVACSSDSSGGGGNGTPNAESPVGQEFQNIASSAGAIVATNEEAYQGLAFTAAAVGDALAGASAAPSVGPKDSHLPPCFGDGLGGTTFAYDDPTGTYTSTAIPGGPPSGVRFLVYQTSGGTPDPNNQLGTLDIVCTGTPQDLSVEVSLTTANDVEVVRASASGFIGPDSSFFSLTGFLASADGSQRVNFGELGSSVNGSSVDFFSIIDFTVGVDTFASISRNLFPTLGEEGLSINVFRGLQMFVFDFRADLFGTGGDLSGPGLFSAANEFGGGTGDLFVACFSGSYENMTVSEASAACDEFAYGEPVPIASGDIAAIQQGYDALRDMHKVVEGLAMAGVAVGQAILASQQPF